MQVWPLGWEDPLEKEMAPHSSALAWKIPWIEEPGGLQSMGSQRIRHDWVTEHVHLHAHTCTHIHTHTLTHISCNNSEGKSYAYTSTFQEKRLNRKPEYHHVAAAPCHFLTSYYKREMISGKNCPVYKRSGAWQGWKNLTYVCTLKYQELRLFSLIFFFKNLT